MSDKPSGLTRNQLAQFAPNARTVRALEQMLKQTSTLLPEDITALHLLIEESYTEAAAASANSVEALALLGRISDSLGLLSSAPVQSSAAPLDDLRPTTSPSTIEELANTLVTTPAAGNVLVYNATLRQWVNALLTQGANVTITNGDGTITIAVSGLGTASTLASDTDGTLAANSDTRVATQKATKTYVDNAVTGLLDFKGGVDCSTNPNYPAALKGDAYVVNVAGRIGGASGTLVDVGDVYVASADNAGGTQAAVGSSWFVLEHNLVGTLLSANNLSDLANATTARSNLGLGNVENKTFATGTADATHAATSKATPVDADELPLSDSASSFSLKKLTWANLKATLATWLNGGTLPVSFTVNKAINFYTEAVSVAANNTTATTIKTLAASTPGVSAYLFTAYVDGGGFTTLAAYALIMVGNTTAVILHQVNGTGVLEITLSGMNVQVWQNTGVVQTVKGHFVRINA